MSIALDFSDMFRQAPEKKPATSIPDNTLPRDVSVESENIPPSAEANDVSSWVKSTLGSLNFVVKDEDLNPSSVSMWQRVLTERLHWQNQCQAVMEENISLRRKFDSLDREKTALKTQVETLSQDIGGVQNKMAAMQEDQRQLRCQWLAEKNELESRCFQLQGLTTQYQGTIRKKDKEYDKLQIQLSKMVKDSQRGQKSLITLTKPLPKNFQESLRPGTTLRDAELADAKTTIANIQAENNNLRVMFNSLTENYEDMQRRLVMNSITALMESDIAEKEEDATSPAARKISEACSPVARPYQHLVKQASSSAKEATRLSLSPQKSTKTNFDDETLNKLQSSLQDALAKLSKAQSVITEQDSLIHAALVGKLPGISQATEDLNFDMNELDTTMDGELNSDDILTSISDDHVFHVRDFISPASPATMALLGSAGAFWSPVVPQSTIKRTAPTSSKREV